MFNVNEYKPIEGWKKFNENVDRQIDDGNITLGEAIGFTLCVVAIPFIICLFAV